MSNCSLIDHKGATPQPMTRLCTVAVLLAAMMLTPVTRAVEVLTVHELVSHCELMETEPTGADAQYCVRYVQGFIDGAVATDVNVMLNIEAETNRGESFSDRAKRTRAPSRADQFRAAWLAGFCLGDPLPLRDVVDQVVADLVRLDVGDSAGAPARESVYRSLREHYPCASE
jgi:Rap1a immunity proteins